MTLFAGFGIGILELLLILGLSVGAYVLTVRLSVRGRTRAASA